jgi:hypothetical protein
MGARTLLLVTLTSCLLVGRQVRGDGPQTSRGEVASPHVVWVVEALKQMQTVKPGTTRVELLRVLAPEGGLSTRTQRTYMYRGCMYFHVDVTFAPVEAAGQAAQNGVSPGESGQDVVSKVSRPYLDWAHTD